MRRKTGLSPPVTILLTVPRRYFFCVSFVFLYVLYSLVVTCWERADLLALVCDVLLGFYHFPIGILIQVWCLIVSIPDLCHLSSNNLENAILRKNDYISTFTERADTYVSMLASTLQWVTLFVLITYVLLFCAK